METKDFITKAEKKHKNPDGSPKYLYNKSVYINSREKLIVTCPIHGDFEQIPSNHLFKTGCPMCSGNKKLTTTDFIKKAEEKHKNPDGSPKYLYNKTVYISSNKGLVTITCPIHGDFEQRADMHLHSQGCPKCAGNVKLSLSQHIKDFKEKHKNPDGSSKYSYDKIFTMNNSESIITITCPIHGDFEQRADMHKFGYGCPKCAIQDSYSNTDEFVTKAKLKHKNPDGSPIYDYSKTEYIHSKQKVIITCKKHGDFEIIPNGHLTGNGCFKCALESTTSKAELEIGEFISSLGFEIETSNRTILSNNKELDIYIPSKKIAIEYNGLFWHSELYRDKNYHIQKTQECQEKGIHLIQIFEDEWINNIGIVKSRLSNILGVTQFHTYARKCELRYISSSEAESFLDRHHIQGSCNSSIQLGLFKNNKLLAVMTFGNLRKNLGSSAEPGKYELLRFCNFVNLNIVGGASKLLNRFIKDYSPKEIVSYCDLRWSDGNLYEKLGFTFSHQSIPSYFYIFGQTRKNRYGFRKDILIKKYGCSSDDTEHNFCLSNGWYRIYDCGTKLYKLIIK
jgi:hypothetical protein